MTVSPAPQNIQLLDGQLRLRWSTGQDVDRVMALTAVVFRESVSSDPDYHTGRYARSLLSGEHPVMSPEDFALVEDTTTSELVACSCLMQNRWRYGSCELPVGRPELVATDERYRRRGLIRHIFGALHHRSATRGDLALGITGIPYFYRQFGYEYALDLSSGRRVYFVDLPKASDTPPPVTLRPATEHDAAAFHSLVERNSQRWTVAAVSTETYWHYKLRTAGDSDADWRAFAIIDARGATIGVVVFRALRERSFVQVRVLEIEQTLSLRPLVVPLLYALERVAQSLPVSKPLGPVAGIEFQLGEGHPWLVVLGPSLLRHQPRNYAWYVRLPHVPRFVRAIAPVLEDRLRASPFAGYSGELLLDFYRSGLRIAFEGGRVIVAEYWRRHAWEEHPFVALPDLTFLKLLFGYQSLHDLLRMYPDAWGNDGALLLLDVLFPRLPSYVLPLD
ncbi:MAG: GNAT family N-acetyltransferase [Chloroflexi bacterium]|nr:GNAT family N-acetyltransferase [Chloroflexota bacterium]